MTVWRPGDTGVIPICHKNLTGRRLPAGWPYKGRFPLSAFALLAAAALASAPPADAQLAAAPPVAASPSTRSAAATPDPLPPLAGEIPPPSGEIVVSGAQKAPPEDPLAKANQTSYEVLQKADDLVVGPVASGYQKAVPRPLRMALRNFIRNLREPVAAAAFLLELKPGKMFETVGRFGINSTIGLGGTIDVARSKPFNQNVVPSWCCASAGMTMAIVGGAVVILSSSCSTPSFKSLPMSTWPHSSSVT